MALFTDDDLQPAPSTPPERIRPKRSVIVGWSFVGAAFILTLVLALVPAPYVIEQPGPVFNTLGTDQPVGSTPSKDAKLLITIPSKTTYPTAGSLDLLTVSVVGNPDSLPSWIEVASAWFTPSKAVLPVDSVFPPGVTTEQSNKENAQLMVDSQQDAIAAALNELGYTYPQEVVVKQIIMGSPADGVLKVGDEIITVNGVHVPGVQTLRDLLKKNGAGKPATIGIIRDGKPSTVQITPEKSGPAVIVGIGAGMHYSFPFDVMIQLNNVGGPSAGQMFALGIIDKLTPGKLNGGQRVAGTGTIDNEGNIGAIGGIRQKMYAAKGAGNTWFLAPQVNCDEVTGHIPPGLTVFAVKKLDDSLAVMKALSSHSSTAAFPRCPAS
ncbi:PDZ domain-containing protein [Diaminobutyricibacter tongyongensis]|uniref:PDZ domain-containing protein n=1 Tax=Leifsonia tongyongensis TaxID=1268043 RepID=A0A6L9XZJ4_9MICO|nr:PDZ domain-containing protein [Diaminobutyricibacter tongyongensis]